MADQQNAFAQPSQPNPLPESAKANESALKTRRAELLALFRILMQEPPPDHDFRTCPICKEFGITSI